MKINEVLERLEDECHLKVKRSKIHHYDREGLIKVERDELNARDFDEEAYQRLKTIILLRHAGISPDDVKDYLEFKFSDKIQKQLQELQLLTAWLLEEVRDDSADSG